MRRESGARTGDRRQGARTAAPLRARRFVAKHSRWLAQLDRQPDDSERGYGEEETETESSAGAL